MTIGEALYSSRSEEWATPQEFFASLDAEFGPFTLDPCATATNAKCDLFYTKKQDGLTRPWAPHVVFCNPPYGRGIWAWLEKAVSEAQRGALVVCLFHARTDTRWWHDFVEPHAALVRFVRGRLKFGDGTQSAPFPSVIVVFGRRKRRRHAAKPAPRRPASRRDQRRLENKAPQAPQRKRKEVR